MKNRISALSCYMAALFLFLFYIVVLLKSKEMDVSLEYRMFYIDDQLAYYLEDGGLQNYGVNQKLAYVTDGTYRNQGRGWGEITENGTWTSGSVSYLYFYIKNPSAATGGFDLIIHTSESVGKSAEVVVNQRNAGKNQIGRDGVFNVRISEEILREGVNELILQTDAAESERYLLVKTVELNQMKRNAKKEG